MNPLVKLLQPSVAALVTSVAILTAVSATARAQDNTYYGVGALHSGTNTGLDDSAFGFDALYHNTSGGSNTAVGMNALLADTTGGSNTAAGVNALSSNTTGSSNTAAGQGALSSNTKGSDNFAAGYQALHLNTSGSANTAIGCQALYNCTTDFQETATGYQALYHETSAFFLDNIGTPTENTADGFQSLYMDSSGVYNVASGYQALYENTTGGGNTADGDQALFSNQTGNSNTAVGYEALYFNNGGGNTGCGASALEENSSGSDNTAVGTSALGDEVNSSDNTAVGYLALNADTSGSNNTSIGCGALSADTSGYFDAAGGAFALGNNSSGAGNTAFGYFALAANTTASDNTAVGDYALYQSTGGNVIGLGVLAGGNLTSGSNDIYIGSEGVATESNTIRIGNGYGGNQTATYIAGIGATIISGGAEVFVLGTGQLGVAPSSRRYKQDIKTMGDASDVLLSLRPVTFKYKSEFDPRSLPQFGLVAEEVEKVSPGLVVHDKEGKPFSVRYEAVNAMLLNEFLKEHDKVSKLEASNSNLETAYAEQQQEIKSLTAMLKEQASLLRKVSAQIEESGPQVVSNNNQTSIFEKK
jgi:uncharacterized coiled-coil protein SlyX